MFCVVCERSVWVCGLFALEESSGVVLHQSDFACILLKLNFATEPS